MQMALVQYSDKGGPGRDEPDSERCFLSQSSVISGVIASDGPHVLYAASGVAMHNIGWIKLLQVNY
jgi:hypothetical protein